jgi:GTP-binding protein
MSSPLLLRYVMSAPDVAALPSTSAEVAVVGRSNVGKSSLINALGTRQAVAKVSKSPGRTQLINLYELAGGGSLVDLPGYGYAAVPQRVRAGWPAMISGYLLERSHLRRVMLLVDGEIGPTKLDLDMIAWLHASDIVHTVVATKQDKVKSSRRLRRADELADVCGVAVADVVWVSAARGAGIEHLRRLVRVWLSATD